jgi:hypothetical protein
MPLASIDAVDITSLVAWRPDYLPWTMIRTKARSKPPRVKCIDRPSSLGTLDRLPLEIQHSILNMLDLQTISHISRVSSHALAVVQFLPTYRELLQHAPYIVDVLGRTKLLGLHTLIQLRRVLRSDRCESCPEYGAFLFLPTCVRCCWECMMVKPSLRAISPKQAKRYFGLKDRHVQQLPTMHTIPDVYSFSRTPDWQSSCPLVSAVAAKEQGILVHGSAEKLAKNLVKRLRAGGSIMTGRFLQRACMNPLREDYLSRPCQGNIPPDDFSGMAIVPFPSLQVPGTTENGLWCKGCHHTFQLYQSRRLDSVILSGMVPTTWDPSRVLLGMARRAWSRTSFLEHTRHCFGVQKLTQDLACKE